MSSETPAAPLPGRPGRVGPRRGRRVVALGGGHGLSASLQALRYLTEQLTAVVTVADDGGSSGRLRKEFDVLPPGDLRMALAALSEETVWGQRWGAVLQHRMGRVPAPRNGHDAGTALDPGGLRGHALGNLLLVALWEMHGDAVRGLEEAARLLNIRGRVLPMSTLPLEIEAEVELGTVPGGDAVHVRGQSALALAPGRLRQVRLVPPDPPACDEAVTEVMLADWVVLGPGSWFTSVLPHLMVPELRDAIVATPARRILTLNVSMHDTETVGLDVVDHVRVLHELAPELRLDVVLADPEVVGPRRPALEEQVAALGGDLVVTTVGSPRRPGVHDTLRLAAAYRDVVTGHER